MYAAEGDNFQARGTLNSIIDNNFPVAEIVEAARQRLKTLGADQPDDTASPATSPKATPAKTLVTAPAKAPTKTPAKPAATPASAKGKTTAPRTNLRGNTTAPADTTQR